MAFPLAAEGLIVLDIGILMQSRSLAVFEDQAAFYPGAQKAYDIIKTIACECNDSMCAMNAFQTFLNQGSHNNRGLAAQLLTEVDNAGPLDYHQLRDLQYDFYTRHLPQEEQEPQSLFERLIGRTFRGRVIPLVAVPSVEPEAPADNLGDDEPEHGGPREE